VYKIEIDANNVRIHSKENMKVLRILLDNKLNWESHIQKIIKSCRSQFFALRYLRVNLSVTFQFAVFNAQWAQDK